MNRTRYLDVMTIRPSNTAGTVRQEPHASLFVEPILLPDMAHVHIDPAFEADSTCLFYPTGAKNVNMKQRIEAIVRDARAPIASRVDPQAILSKSFPKNFRQGTGTGGRRSVGTPSLSVGTDISAINRSKSFGSGRSHTVDIISNEISGGGTAALRLSTAASSASNNKLPKPRVALFRGRRRDPEMVQLLKSARINEAKLEVTVTVKT